jgi:glucokinase
METVLAVDIGATKFAAAVVDAAGGMHARATVATPAGADPSVVAGALANLVRDVTSADPARPVRAVGIASAGPVDPAAGTVSPVNIPAWRGFDIVAAVGALLPDRPVVLAGDGHGMALGEYWRAGGARTMLGVVVSTGVGGGFVLDGQLYPGPTGNAGHIGHIVVDLEGPDCPCGGRGCVEVYASGPSMVAWARSYDWVHPTADGRSLAHDARLGHPVAVAAFRRGAQALAAAIVSAAALVDLDEVVIGGGVAAAGEVLFNPLQESIRRRAGLGFVRRVCVRPSRLGPDAGLPGAAALALGAAPS